MKKLSDSELEELNKRDFEKDGCKWPHLTNWALAKEYSLLRIYSGGDTGRLIGYERFPKRLDVK